MAGEKPRSSGPAWRQQAKSPSQPASGKHDWQKSAGKQPPSPSQPWSKKIQLGLVGLGLLLVGGLIAWVVLWLRPTRPPELILVFASNAGNLGAPHNVFGQHGLKGVSDWGEAVKKADPNAELKIRWVDLATEGAAWDAWVAECKGGITHKPVKKLALYLAVHGGADSEGAFLIPHGADPADRKSLLRMSAVLGALRQLPDAQKLLILDVTQVPASWPFGIFRNDFVRELEKEQIAEIPNLVVICSSGNGQRSWVSEEWGTTIFAHYLVEGLGGAADGRRSKDGRIDVWELFDYVRENVRGWVRDNRDAFQEPILLGGDQRAQGMELVLAGKQAPRSPEEAPELKELAEAWKERDQLARRYPVGSAPHLWRCYLETLLRVEQLYRAGDTASADDLVNKQLPGIRSRIEHAAASELQSAGNSLAIASVFGTRLPADETRKLTDAFQQLWSRNLPAEKESAEMARLVQDGQPTSLPARRLLLIDLLYQRAIVQPNDLDRAADILLSPAFHDESAPRPAEAHFLVMLKRDRFSSLSADRIKQALEVRRLAEAAALGLTPGDRDSDRLPAYSEQVLSWIEKKLQEADGERQLGEDLLFASKEDDWKKADTHLKNARERYGKEQEAALALRRAFFVRDKLLAMLPYYSHWLAGQRKEDADLVSLVVSAWKELHQLDSRLAQPGADPAELARQAQKLKEQFQQRVRDPFDARCAVLAGDFPVFTQSRWHDLEELLVVPFIPAELRLKLLERSREVSRHLNAKERSDSPTRTAEEEQAQANDQARRQARLALAMIGQEWFDSSKSGTTHEGAIRDLQDLDRAKDHHRAAERTAEHWNRRLKEVQERTGKGCASADLGKAGEMLHAASRQARHLDGAAVARLGSPDPIDEGRQLRLYDLLYGQAARALSDHWFSEEKREPYFRVAGQAYLTDARRLAGKDRNDLKEADRTSRLAQAEGLAGKLHDAGRFTVKWHDGIEYRTDTPTLVVTDESSLVRHYRIEAPESVKQGYPVVWFKRGKWLQAKEEGTVREVLKRIDAKLRQDGTTDNLVPERLPKEPRSPRVDRTEHGLRGFFRGQELGLTMNVELHRLPEIVAGYQRQGPGAIAVVGDKELVDYFQGSNTAIAIVLDASNSMNAPEGKRPNRFDHALEALGEVLRLLPPQVVVSLRVFADKDGDGSNKLLWKPMRWDPSATDDWIQKLRKDVTPLGYTPLIDSTVNAQNDFPPGFGGSRSVVVITDGADTSSKKTTEQFRKQWDRKIPISLIGFDLDKTEVEKSAEFRKTVEDLGGKYYPAKGSKELAARLKEAMLGMGFWLEKAKTGEPVAGGEISGPGEGLRWIRGIQAGRYSLQMRIKGTEFTHRAVEIEPGDFLMVRVSRRGEDLHFEPNVYWKSAKAVLISPLQPPVESGDWSAAVFQNQYQRGSGALELMATLERSRVSKLPEGIKGTVLQAKPKLTLFEVRPQGNKDLPPVALRYHNLARYPAPAWGLEVPAWPTLNAQPVPSVLETWWSDPDDDRDRDPGLSTHPYATLVRAGVHFDLGVRKKVQAKIGRDEYREITLESITVQKAPASLVVRLSYDPKDGPFLVRVRDDVTKEGHLFAAHEHSFYTQAGRYTGVFPGWTGSEERLKTLALEVVSVRGFKEFAEKSGFHARTVLGSPADQNRPPPVP